MRFRAMLRMEWLWLRSPLLILAAAALVTPSLGMSGLRDDALVGAAGLISRGEVVGLLLAVLAVITGVVVAQVLWSADARVGHGYARTLPIARQRFLWHRALGGLLLLVLPAVAIALGVMLAVSRIELAPGVEPYPLWTAARALAAMWLAFALTFCFRFGMTSRARRIALGVIGAVLVTGYLEVQLRPAHRRPVSDGIRDAMTSRWSPLAVVLGPWRIVDI